MTEERLEDTQLYKKIQRRRELDKLEEEQKREEIEHKEKTDLFRKIPDQAKYWIKTYLNLSGIQRNEYSQIVDKYKRLSMSQIRGILREVHGYNVSEEMIGKYKRFLIKEGLLKTDKEFEEDRPSEEELRQIRKEGARATSIGMSKEKEHLDPKELEDILKRGKEGKEELAQEESKEIRIRKLKDSIEIHGYCPTCEEEEQLEEFEEKEED